MAFGWGGMADTNVDRGWGSAASVGSIAAPGGIESGAGAASGYGQYGAIGQEGPGDYWNMGKQMSREDWLDMHRGGQRKWERMSMDEFDAWNEYKQTYTMSTHYMKGKMQRPVPEEETPPEAEREIGTTPGFERVQKFLRQQSATGRTITPEMIRGAWQGYWGAWSDKESERARVGLEEERLDLSKERFAYEKEMGWARYGLDEESQERADKAAAAAGGASIGTTIGFVTGGPVGGMIGGMVGGMIGGSK